MKKTIVISFILTFALTGCSLNFTNNKDTAATTATDNNAAPVDTSLLGQLQNGQGVECKVETLNGEVNIRALAGKVRIEDIPYTFNNASSSVDATAENTKGTSLTIGDEQYMWSGLQGVKFNAKELNEQSGGTTDEQMGNKSWQDTVGEWQTAGFNYQCEKRNLTDSIFTPPADVVFNDLNEALRNLQNIMQSASTSESVNNSSSTERSASAPVK
jgi:hypothetical protein